MDGKLTHLGVIGFAAMSPSFLGRPFAQFVLFDPRRAFGLKAWRDLPDIMNGGKHRPGFKGKCVPESVRDVLDHFSRHASHIQAVVAYRDPWSAIFPGLCPAILVVNRCGVTRRGQVRLATYGH